jgi:RHS repeat-associated protein
MVTGHQGAVVARHDYQPFGVEVSPPPSEARVRFAGKEHDEETGGSGWQALDYFGARYLHSASGRFTGVDPVVVAEQATSNPQLWNRYPYVRNNPNRYVDPDGRVVMSLSPEQVATINAQLERKKAVEAWVSDKLDDLVGDSAAGAIASLVGAFFDPAASMVPTPTTAAVSGGSRTVFVGTQSGTLVRVPAGWLGRVADNGKGVVFQQAGAKGNANMMRIMDATADSPSGYVRYYNQYGQPVSALGTPGSKASTHIPLDYQGILTGWP